MDKKPVYAKSGYYRQSMEDEKKSGAVVKNGEMLLVENGKISKVESVAQEPKINPESIIIKSNGSKIKMREGDYLDESGALILTRKQQTNSLKKGPITK